MREGFNQAQLRIEALAIYFLKLIRIMSHVIAVLAVMLSFISTEAQGFSLLTNKFCTCGRLEFLILLAARRVAVGGIDVRGSLYVEVANGVL